MKPLFLYIILFIFTKTIAQQNCETYKISGNISKYNACKKAEKANNYYQFSKEFQEILDQSINIDSTYAHAYREKSVAYLKSGDFVNWKKLIDKAVKYDPKENLGYRGWCRYQFFRDYKGAIEDIEMLDKLVNYDIGDCVNGDYHLNIAKALCYKAIGNKEKAIEIIENQLNNKSHYIGLYDYLHLGVLYLETNKYEKAKRAFEKQEIEYDFAENQFYLALTYKASKDISEYKEHLNNAKKLFLNDLKMFDPYTHQMDKIYLEQIETEIKTAYNNVHKK